MDQTKQRTAIAEHLGYIDVREYAVDMDDDCLWLMGRKSQKEPLEFIEYYTNDLNAMHEAEEHLSTEEVKTYMGHLLDIMGISVWCITHVSAEQRAEAFLKTIGKWEE